MSFVRLNRNGAASLSRQLADQIRASIVSGQLHPGERVPATRKLAESLGVSRTVVVNAYDQLLGEAFLEGVAGSGTRVSRELPDWLQPRMHEIVPPPTLTEQQPLPSSPLIDLAPGYPYVAPDPPRDWLRALSAAAHDAWSAPVPGAVGARELREQLAAHVRFFRGVPCNAEDVVITSGTSEALLLVGLALRTVQGSAPRIAVETPGYPEGRRALELAGAECHAVPVSANGIDLAALQSADHSQPLAAVMLTPSHQYPMGGRLPADERIAILEWAHARGATVIEDDYDSEFRHTGPALPSMASLDAHGRTVYIASLNKTFHPSLRCGFIVLPAGDMEFRAAILAARGGVGATVSAHTQFALARFIEGGGLKRAVARNRREYQHRRSLLLAHFADSGLPVSGADGGLHVVLQMPAAIDARELAGELRTRDVHVEPLADFTVPPGSHESANGLIIGYGQETVPRLMQGLARVTEALRARGYPG
ncbi:MULTISPECIES: PLP-dependent aminotransferase family protein [unclassified Leucobacter]|uniref:MocR-like pyridoxine biosynthesis transcription factor PdxR n=1 Tax=unclassified Leucobacter TaxID=2621730 RepID=UPI002040574F|nr:MULTISPECIES: PLP-dependent aminotransferase family protein [unclassified Leucobacter]